jgi:hypothetical protein
MNMVLVLHLGVVDRALDGALGVMQGFPEPFWIFAELRESAVDWCVFDEDRGREREQERGDVHSQSEEERETDTQREGQTDRQRANTRTSGNERARDSEYAAP